jgi:hypothetical protein
MHGPSELDARLQANNGYGPAIPRVTADLQGSQIDASGNSKHDPPTGAQAQTEAGRQQCKRGQHGDREDGDKAQIGHVAELNARETPHPQRDGGKHEQDGDEQRQLRSRRHNGGSRFDCWKSAGVHVR